MSRGVKLCRRLKRVGSAHLAVRPLKVSCGWAQVANPAIRFGVQQVDKLRPVDGLKRSSTSEAAFVEIPINLPPWGHVEQMCTSFDRKGESRPLSLATADRADAYKQLLITRGDELSAVGALGNRTDGLRYG